ncbi:MAG TPA: tRNA 2-thiouridine(34) synthase MnmA [Thermoanaerobaculia bacterium]|nr:tRNA 2-thiouridine(34) synthase MnmA [Thermoanaerobaculia bacterium]
MSASGLTAVAMSGGLDSSVTALLLARAGEPVVGLSMLLWEHSGEPAHGRCCGALDLGDARRVAQQIGIPHYTLRMDEEFRAKVVDPFVQDYLAGRTPSPCVSCNTWIKFDRLLAKARAFGAETVATGHYARILEGPDGPELHTGLDAEKDQSYYLFELTREQLAASRFPLGEMRKGQVRALAREAGLVVAGKGESMEVCFVAGGVGDFVEHQVAQHPERYAAPEATEPAAVVTAEGRSLGAASAPYYRYTVGQRRGLGVAGIERLYVIGIEPEANRVTVGSEENLLSPGLVGERLHWIGDPERLAGPGGEVRATVKIRSRHPGVEATVRPLPEGQAEILFDQPQRGVAPGQAAVFYRGSRVLGGCWIRASLPPHS